MARSLLISIILVGIGTCPMIAQSGPTNGSLSGTNAAAALSRDKKPVSTGYTLSNYFDLGGIFMYPLLLLAAGGLALVSERIIQALRHPSGGDPFANGMIATLERGDNPHDWCKKHHKLAMARIFEKALLRYETSGHEPELFLKEVETLAAIDIAARERNLALIASIANLSPLVGFLGTVTGMIGAFGSIAAADTVSAKVVSSGIFEALITTAAGLVIAIPAFAFHNYSVHRIDRLASTIEKTAAEVSALLTEQAR